MSQNESKCHATKKGPGRKKGPRKTVSGPQKRKQ